MDHETIRANFSHPFSPSRERKLSPAFFVFPQNCHRPSELRAFFDGNTFLLLSPSMPQGCLCRSSLSSDTCLLRCWYYRKKRRGVQPLLDIILCSPAFTSTLLSLSLSPNRHWFFLGHRKKAVFGTTRFRGARVLPCRLTQSVGGKCFLSQWRTNWHHGVE